MAEVASGEETKECSNCNRQIEVSKIRMHEIGCARQYYRCKQCNEMVLKSEREEHEEECANRIKCKYCDFEFLDQSLELIRQLDKMMSDGCRYFKNPFIFIRSCDLERISQA